MSIKDKIIYISIELFNCYGECVIIINYIVVYMGISFGNLYYYFKNKEDIICYIFVLYSEYLYMYFKFLFFDDDVFENLVGYFDLLFELMWCY